MKKGIAIQTDLNRPNENAVEDLSCTTKFSKTENHKHFDWLRYLHFAIRSI
jgi:hypothetical protein